MPTESRHQVRDIAVRLWRDGAGEPVLFLHGASGPPPWGSFCEAIAKRHDLMVPEHPGFGTSDHPGWIRNVADVAMYYLDFIDALGVPKVHIVGHSLGGWIAAELAVRNATQLKSLTLLAPAGVRIKGMPGGDLFIWTPQEFARNSYYDQSLAERDLAQPVSEEEADIRLTNSFMAAKLGWEPRWFNPALERWLHRIKVPTFVLWGRDDKIFPDAYAKVWGDRIPDVKVEIIPECGHRPHVEKADLTSQKIVSFMDGVRR